MSKARAGAFKKGLEVNGSQDRTRRRRLQSSLRDEARSRLVSSKRRRPSADDASDPTAVVPVSELVSALSGNDAQRCRKALALLRNAPNVATVPALIAVAINQPELRDEALWCLSALSHTNDDDVISEIVGGVAPLLVELVGGGSLSACWLLANLAAHDLRSRASLRAFPFIAQLRTPLASSDDELARTAAWALCSLVRGPNDAASIAALLEGGAGAICVEGAREALQQRRWAVLAEHLWSSAYLSASGPDASRALVALGHAPTLVATLAIVATVATVATVASHHQHDKDDDVEELQKRSVHDAILAALRCAGNFCSCDDALVESLVACDASPLAFVDALAVCVRSTDNTALQKEAAWTIANVCGGRREHAEALAKTGVIAMLHRVLLRSPFAVKKEVIFALLNLARIPEYFMAVWNGASLMPHLLEIMNLKDPEVSGVALRFLSLLLERGPKDEVIRVAQENDAIEILENLRMVREDLAGEITRVLDQYIDPIEDVSAPHADEGENVEYPAWRLGAKQTHS